jgi:hypothetical protein
VTETDEIPYLGSEQEKRKKHSLETYERSYGSMPQTHIVAAEIMKEVEAIEEEVTSGQESVATEVETQRRRQSLETYERSYGSMPETDIVAAEIVREAIETGEGHNLGAEVEGVHSVQAYGNMQEDFENLDVATPTPESALWSLLNK